MLLTPLSVRFSSLALTRIFALVGLTWQVVTTILLAVAGQYHMYMYTYWSYTALTAFYAVLSVALFWERLAITLFSLFWLPFVMGNSVFVLLAITIIIANDATAYIDGSVCDTPPGSLTIEKLHTGDTLIHVLPVLWLGATLLAGLEYFSQRLIVAQVSAFSAAGQWLYWLFWMTGPLVLISIYQLAFDVDKLYPTSFSVGARVAILGAVSITTQLGWWIILTQHQIVHQIHAHSLPTPLQVLSEGRLHGHLDYEGEAEAEAESGHNYETAGRAHRHIVL